MALINEVKAKDALKNYYEGYVVHLNQKWKVGVEFLKNGNEEQALVDFIDLGGYNRVFKVKREGSKIHLDRDQPNGGRPLIFDGIIKGDSITGLWSGIGIESAKFLLSSTDKFRYDSEEITFMNDEHTLSGTLLFPLKKGPFPIVIFMHGGSADDREVYRGFAIEFLKMGIACLIYDKRGVGNSVGGNWRTAGITGLAKDALAAVELLKKHDSIDPDKIGLFGHSEGGWTAPMAASISSDISFLIVSGASAVNAADQSVYHRMEVMRSQGFDDDDIMLAAQIRRKLNGANYKCFTNPETAIAEGKKVANEIEAIHKMPWLEASALPYPYEPQCPQPEVMELLFKNPTEIWKNVKVPVYLTWGAEDKVVPVNKHGIILESLKRSGNSNYKVVILPDIDHSGYKVANSEVWDFPRESKEYIRGMASWAKKII